MPRFGTFLRSAGVALLVGVAGCGVRYSLHGGGLPSNIHTMAILPFDNLTASPDVQQELFDALHTELRRRLGVRDAPEQKADAIVRGTITDYQSDIPQAYSAQATSATRRLEITVDIEIVDQASGKVLFQQEGMKTDADYAERAESDGRKKAISQLVDKVVEGAQSQW